MLQVEVTAQTKICTKVWSILRRNSASMKGGAQGLRDKRHREVTRTFKIMSRSEGFTLKTEKSDTRVL